MNVHTPPSPVLESIVEYNRDRKPARVRLKLARMDGDPFAFFRGTDHLFARSWREDRPVDAGPPVLICGDLHLENFGAYEAEGGEYLFDINDFDEAIVAPVGLDLVRCTASILVAAESWRLTPLQATGMALDFLEEYRRTVAARAEGPAVATDSPAHGRGAVWDLLGATAVGDPVALLDRNTVRTRKGKRKIVRSKLKHPPIGDERFESIAKAVRKYGKAAGTPEAYKVLDITARIVGIGSLGLPRYVALIAGAGPPDGNRLLDIKAACPSALRACTEVPQPDHGESEAHRVLHAQRTLQARPALGLDVLEIDGRWYRMRQLIPEENRSSLDRLRKDPARLRSALPVVGRLTGNSHLRGIPPDHGGPRRDALAAWASGPALDAIMTAAVRCAERNRLDYEEFHAAVSRPSALPKSLRPRGTSRGSK